MNKLIALFFALMLSACGTYSQVKQVDDKAYLLLIGETLNIELQIDDGPLIDLLRETKSFDLNGRTATKIEISIGTHNAKVFRKGNLIINRDFYVSNGTSFEVEI